MSDAKLVVLCCSSSEIYDAWISIPMRSFLQNSFVKIILIPSCVALTVIITSSSIITLGRFCYDSLINATVFSSDSSLTY